jgi:hypothetical protein
LHLDVFDQPVKDYFFNNLSGYKQKEPVIDSSELAIAQLTYILFRARSQLPGPEAPGSGRNLLS